MANESCCGVPGCMYIVPWRPRLSPEKNPYTADGSLLGSKGPNYTSPRIPQQVKQLIGTYIFLGRLSNLQAKQHRENNSDTLGPALTSSAK